MRHRTCAERPVRKASSGLFPNLRFRCALASGPSALSFFPALALLQTLPLLSASVLKCLRMESHGKRALSADQAELLRQIPSVDQLLAQPRLAALRGRVDRHVLVEVTRTVLGELRSRIVEQSKIALLGELTLL